MEKYYTINDNKRFYNISKFCQGVSDNDNSSNNINSSNNNNSTSDSSITRKDFLKAMFWGGTGLALGGMGFLKMGNGSGGNSNPQSAFAWESHGGGNSTPMLPMSESERKKLGYQIRKRAADRTYGIPWPDHINNGEEDDYLENGHRTYIANYSKGLPHNKLGEVDRKAYETLLRAARSGTFEDWERVTVSDAAVGSGLKFFNPLAGLTFPLLGPDPFGLAQPPAPRIDSAEGGSEMAEMYWLALARDVNVNEYEDSDLIERAAEDLSSFSDFHGPKRNGKVTPDTIFRGNLPGTQKGPYISQFALQGTKIPAFGLKPEDGWVIFGWGNRMDQRILTLKKGSDHLTDFKQWLEVQDGFDPRTGEFCSNEYDTTPRFIRYGRDLANWVQYDDLPSQEFTIATCILLHQEVPCMRVVADPAAILRGGSAPFHPGDPYKGSRTQEALFNFGPFTPLAEISRVLLLAMRAVWFQKWYVHRKLRPEEFGGLVHIHKTGKRDYPINRELLESNVFDEPHFKEEDSFLLPQAFPQGCPPHPSYGAGHATASGAMATILKAFFDETFVLPHAFVASDDGTCLERYTGPDNDELTVGGELNKLAANVGIGRNFAGVHYWSDWYQSALLGEKVAIEVLEQENIIYREEHFFEFTKFNGEKIRID
jgi:hypothetical protein